MRRAPVWAVVVLAVLDAGFMLFDGARALVVGDYVGGEIGPWRHVVGAVGIEPESTLMKSIFVVYGAVWLAVVVGFVRGARWGRAAMTAAAAGSLWYLVFGTISSVLQLALLALTRPPRPV